jgi:hypothetical protein
MFIRIPDSEARSAESKLPTLSNFERLDLYFYMLRVHRYG